MKAHQQNGSKKQPTANGDHKGNGKIAHLPKATRDQINVMLRDGAPYPEIRRKLRELGNPDLNSISTRWIFTEGHNASNPASHCDIAWAGGLATEAHTARKLVLTSRLG